MKEKFRAEKFQLLWQRFCLQHLHIIFHAGLRLQLKLQLQQEPKNRSLPQHLLNDSVFALVRNFICFHSNICSIHTNASPRLNFCCILFSNTNFHSIPYPNPDFCLFCSYHPNLLLLEISFFRARKLSPTIIPTPAINPSVTPTSTPSPALFFRQIPIPTPTLTSAPGICSCEKSHQNSLSISIHRTPYST